MLQDSNIYKVSLLGHVHFLGSLTTDISHSLTRSCNIAKLLISFCLVLIVYKLMKFLLLNTSIVCFKIHNLCHIFTHTHMSPLYIVCRSNVPGDIMFTGKTSSPHNKSSDSCNKYKHFSVLFTFSSISAF